MFAFAENSSANVWLAACFQIVQADPACSLVPRSGFVKPVIGAVQVKKDPLFLFEMTGVIFSVT